MAGSWPATVALDVINPATEQVIATAPAASRAQLDQAVAAAGRAFPAWRAMPLAQRQAALAKAAEHDPRQRAGTRPPAVAGAGQAAG
ncbi:aldehyde dehydrogenase family protein [Cupriavidus basilensis]